MTWKPLSVWKVCCISCLIWAFRNVKSLYLFSPQTNYNFDYVYCFNFVFPLYLFKIHMGHEWIVVYWCLFSDLMMLPGILFLLNHCIWLAFLYLLVVQQAYSEERKWKKNATVELIIVYFCTLHHHVQELISLLNRLGGVCGLKVHCVPTAQKADCIVGCIKGSIASRMREGILSLCSAGTPPAVLHPACGLQLKKDTHLL